MKYGNVKGKTVLITGGSSGIGRESAFAFGRLGCKVVFTGRNRNKLKEVETKAKESGMDMLGVTGDVTSMEDCLQAIETAVHNYGDIDILVNNAGMSMRGVFEETNIEVFHKIMDINFSGAVNMTKAALPYLLKSRGSIVFVSSLAGLKGLPGIAPYSAAKMALKSFSESLRCELMGKGVHVGILYVSFTENDPGKKTYNAKGKLVPLTREKNSFSQGDVAATLLKLVAKRKRHIIMGTTGKLAQIAYTVLPGTSEKLIAGFTLRSSRYH